MKRIIRSDYPNRIFGGVCSAISNYFNINLSVVRTIWALSIFVWGIGAITYILLCAILPVEKK